MSSIVSNSETSKCQSIFPHDKEYSAQASFLSNWYISFVALGSNLIWLTLKLCQETANTGK